MILTLNGKWQYDDDDDDDMEGFDFKSEEDMKR